jgi:spore maturation protein CgeB
VLAFGEALARVYRRWGWGERVFVWHEAADTKLFKPPEPATERRGLVWIGNWGDGERTAELETFLLAPAARAGLDLEVHGVRYPREAIALLRRYGARFGGWVANAMVPDVFAHHLATVHVPRRFYVKALPGIPTIRVFEALACGIPLICAPWDDCERLFRPGEDYLVTGDGAAAERAMRDVINDPALAAALAARGLETIRSRHTCAHRAAELMGIAARLALTPTPQHASAS